MSFIFSPSSLKTFVQCPLKFKAMCVDKSVKYTQNAAAKRGTHLHELMQANCMSGWGTLAWDDAKSEPQARHYVELVSKLRQSGWTIQTEWDMGTDASGEKRLEFFDNDPDLYIRCRIDLVALKSGDDTALILDWKTGKKYELDKLQLQVNALCVRARTGVTKFNVGFCYLDSGDFAAEHIELPGHCGLNDPGNPCKEMREALAGAEQALHANEFPATPNRFCHWCGVTTCPHAGK